MFTLKNVWIFVSPPADEGIAKGNKRPYFKKYMYEASMKTLPINLDFFLYFASERKTFGNRRNT